MNRKNKITISLLFFLICYITSFTQSTDSVALILDNTSKLEKLEFWDLQSRKLRKSVSVKSLLPYPRIPFPKVANTKFYDLYDISQTTSNNLKPWLTNKSETVAEAYYLKSYTDYIFSKDSSFLVLVFQLTLNKKSGFSLNRGITSIKIFQVNGNVWNPGFDLKQLMGSPLITKDGNTLCVASGGFGHDDFNTQKIILFNGRSGTEIKEFIIPDRLVLLSPFAKGNIIFLCCDDFEKSGTQYYLIDTVARTIYNKFFSRSELKSLTGHSSSGLHFSRQGNEVLFGFDKFDVLEKY